MARNQTHGTLLKIGDGAGPEVFTTIAQVQRVTPPNKTRSTTEMADHDMTSTKRYIGGKLADLPPVTARIYWDPANVTHDLLQTKLDSGASTNFKLTLPTSMGEWAFSAVVVGFDVDEMVSDDGMLEADVTLQPTGEVLTFT